MEDWRKQAACKNLPTEWWFPDVGGEGAMAKAVEICKTCPVKEPCLDWAIAHEDNGIWGATTPLQRKKLRKIRRVVLDRPEKAVDRSLCGTLAGYAAHRRELLAAGKPAKVTCKPCLEANKQKVYKSYASMSPERIARDRERRRADYLAKKAAGLSRESGRWVDRRGRATK
jgi:hypothetical protein